MFPSILPWLDPCDTAYPGTLQGLEAMLLHGYLSLYLALGYSTWKKTTVSAETAINVPENLSFIQTKTKLKWHQWGMYSVKIHWTVTCY